jgi:uncharacterized protein YneF (UPF0154 family)
MIRIYLIILLLSVIFSLLVILGEYFSRKFEKSKFNKWWRKNIIMSVDDHYPGY